MFLFRLEKRPSIQLITVGPVIDLYGRFAAEKLNRLMELYPDRVFSKPEFTALPPYLFSGADFALIPSRDEPFGLVAVEFGRKGALGVGSRLGGLGLMPGWVSTCIFPFSYATDASQWFPVESISSGHMMSQLSKTIKLALKSTEEERAILRARSAVQRFPVVEWRQRMEDFHKRSINASRHLAAQDAWRPSDGATGGAIAIAEHDDWNPVLQADPSQPNWDAQSAHNSPRMNTPGSPGQWSQETLTPGGDPFLQPPRIQDSQRFSINSNASDAEGDTFSQNASSSGQPEFGNFLDKANRTIARDQKHAPDPFLEAPNRPFGAHNRISSVESIASIVDEKSNSPLNKAIASVSSSCPPTLQFDLNVYSLLMQMVASLNNS
jgi:alpha-1,3-glucan synthase